MPCTCCRPSSAYQRFEVVCVVYTIACNAVQQLATEMDISSAWCLFCICACGPYLLCILTTDRQYTFQFERSSQIHLGKRRTINKLTITGRPAAKCMHASLSSSAGEETETETETERRAKRRVGLTVVTARALPAAAVLYILAS